MRKIQKLMAVCAICFSSAFAMNSSLFSTSKVWKAINVYSNSEKTFAEECALFVGEAGSDALATIALAGTGISTGGIIFVGLAITG